MIFEMQNMRSDYIRLVNFIAKFGQPVNVRGQDTREFMNMQLHIDPYGVMLPLSLGRKINTNFAAMEALQVIAGVCEPELLALASPRYASVLVNSSPEAVKRAAYGPRLLDQLAEIVRLLTMAPSTRQAVAHIHNASDLSIIASDIPCTLTLQFMIRDGHLFMTTNMRSNDVWLGTAYDVFVFTQLMWSMLYELNYWRHMHNIKPQLQLGQYTHIACSMHIYDRDVETARSLLSVIADTEVAILPKGIVVDGSEATADTALMLLRGTATQEMIDRNQWYVDRLARVGIAQNDSLK